MPIPIAIHSPGGILREASFTAESLEQASFPMPSGGITPSMVPQVMKDLGSHIVIGSGGGIHAHPAGPTAGARAFRQAIEAVLHGRSLKDAATEHEELAQTLEAWKDPFGAFSL